MNNDEKLLYFKSSRIEISNIVFNKIEDSDDPFKKALEINVTDSYRIHNYDI